MDEEHSWLLIKHVTMDCGHLNAVCPKRPDQRIYFIAGDQKVSGDRGVAAAGRLEVDRVGHAGWPGRCEGRTHLRDRVAPWYRKLVDPAVGLSLYSDDLVEHCRVEIDCGWRVWRCGRRAEG